MILLMVLTYSRKNNCQVSIAFSLPGWILKHNLSLLWNTEGKSARRGDGACQGPGWGKEPWAGELACLRHGWSTRGKRSAEQSLKSISAPKSSDLGYQDTPGYSLWLRSREAEITLAIKVEYAFRPNFLVQTEKVCTPYIPVQERQRLLVPLSTWVSI